MERAVTGVGRDSRRSTAILGAASKPLVQKIAIPPKGGANLLSPRLVEAAMPNCRRLTVLKAPAGFGKTTLLAECCRHLVREGVSTAWISLDNRDNAAVLESCIAHSCNSAGLKLPEMSPRRDTNSETLSGVALIARSLEKHKGIFVIAVDDVDLLNDPESVELLKFLLDRGPPNLHLAMTCRELPQGLNVGGAYLEGRATVLDEEDLRFSKSEVARFLGHDGKNDESNNALTGWPIAVRFARDTRHAAPGNNKVLGDSVANWMDSRLFGRLTKVDQSLLFDVGLFDWFDPELLDHVLLSTGSPRRIFKHPEVRGLLKPIPGDSSDRWQLHPLIRRHCVRRRFQETPDRFKEIHLRLSKALMRRGETLTAMRHAIKAGENTLAGDVLEDAGVAGTRIRQGLTQFIAADRLLNEKIISNRPRLKLFRSLGLALSGRFELAQKSFATAESTIETSAYSHELLLDEFIVRCDIALCGGEQVDSKLIRKLRTDLSKLRASESLDSLTLSHLDFRLAAGYQLMAEFDAALVQFALAREKLDKDDYLNALIDLEAGQINMAQGRAADAETNFSGLRKITSKIHAFEVQSRATARILLEELALERNRLAPRQYLMQVPRMLAMTSRSFSAQAAASAMSIELCLRHKGVEAALSAAGDLLEFYSSTGSRPIVKCVSALQISLLSVSRVDEAEREWRLRDLPEDPAECLDLSMQTWREMEVLSCARLRMLSAQGRFDQARGFAADFRRIATERGLKRTLMRALSLSISLERLAGNEEAAKEELRHFLRHFEVTPYAWPMVRDYEINRPVVEAYLDCVSEPLGKDLVSTLLAEMHPPKITDFPLMSKQELQVLEYLGTHKDKEIARILGLSPYGVRYHIRKIFTKLGAVTRADADRRARELGLLVGK